MSKSAQAFLTRSLRENPWGLKTARILAASVAAVDPSKAIECAMQRVEQTLIIAGQEVDLSVYNSIYLLALGKAALAMASAVADIIPERLSAGLILTKNIDQANFSPKNKFTIFQGGHPIPNQDSLDSTKEIIARLSNLTEQDLVIVLISGGGSALFTAPAPGISLADIQDSNQVFLDHGLDIQEINIIRKHLSLIKGGQLAGILFPAKTITMILSDVIGDPVDIIASGPTVPDNSTFQDALKVIEKYKLEEFLPRPVVTHLKKGLEGNIPETPKPGDPIFKNQLVRVIAGNKDAIEGGLQRAYKEGFNGKALSGFLVGEARVAGQNLAKLLLDTSRQKNSLPLCLIAGGESTVILTDTKKPGKGGRNLETALSAVRILADQNNIAFITLATDGEDGVTDAAGAVVTGTTLTHAAKLGLDPDEFLKNHDAYTFFEALGDLLLPGVTGTNTNDLCFLFSF